MRSVAFLWLEAEMVASIGGEISMVFSDVFEEAAAQLAAPVSIH